ncbi:phosphoribosyltransferase [Gillisia sp. Q332]|uniref:phosphoribosyltransferase n=1 Tax=Gillisia xinjiangensis TaxID=3384765 RepID=UPI003919ECF4
MFISCLNFIKNLFSEKSRVDFQSEEISDLDYESLCELYYKNEWLGHQINKEGLEKLWFDYTDHQEKKILIQLINNFTYLTQEDSVVKLRQKLDEGIRDWSLLPKNTLFIGFRKHKFPDGSEILLNQIKAILVELNGDWQEQNLIPDFHYGIERIKKGGFTRDGLFLKNIVLVDDFIGTGGTAEKNLKHLQNILSEVKGEHNLKIFSVAAMKSGIKKIKKLDVSLKTCIELDKATTIIYPIFKRKKFRKKIVIMERILYKGKDPESLEKFSLGFGKSETLYSWGRFNLPNNNLPLFWWNRYTDGSKRKALFNRMQ